MTTREIFDLTGKTALVTGGRRGIGLAIVEALAAFGADIVVASQNLETTGEPAERVTHAAGREYLGIKVDMSDRGAVREFTARVREQVDGLDILVNNAGTIRRQPASEHTDDNWDEVIATNLAAPFVITRDLGRAMIDRGSGGKVIFTASLLSHQGGLNVVSYTAAKSGIAGITRAFANEWARHRINVNAIVPGYIATDTTQALQDDPERSRSLIDRIPAARWGRPADLAGVAVLLSSAASDYMDGTLVAVDGGWLAR